MSVRQPVFFREVDSPTSNASSPMLICQFANVQSTFWKKVWNVFTNRRRKSISLSLHVKLSRSMAHSNQGLQTILIKSWSTTECIWKLCNIPTSSPTHVTVNLFVWTGLSVQLFLLFSDLRLPGLPYKFTVLTTRVWEESWWTGKSLTRHAQVCNPVFCTMPRSLHFTFFNNFFSFYFISLQHKGHY